MSFNLSDSNLSTALATSEAIRSSWKLEGILAKKYIRFDDMILPFIKRSAMITAK